MQNSSRKIAKMGKSLQKVGKNLSIGITAPLAAMAAVSLKNWDAQEKAIAQVEAALRSTGGAVGYTSDQLKKMASDLQGTSLFGDEEILQGATAQLLTFTNIAGEQFARTQQAALDLATRLDGDLKSASIQLGKALNDPVANLSALSRSGIQFSVDQKAMINSLVKTNQLAKAQTVILDELEKQYGGSAEAASKAGLGPFKQLSNILGDLSEDFGAIIGEALLPFVAKLKTMAEGFRNLSEPMKKTIVIIGALVAAIGPLLVILGTLMTTVIPGLITAFTFLSGTVIPAVVSGFSTLTAVMLANPIVALTAGVVAITAAFLEMVQTITPAVSKLKTFFNLIKSGGNFQLFLNAQTLDQIEGQEKLAKSTDKVSDRTSRMTEMFAGWNKELADSVVKVQKVSKQVQSIPKTIPAIASVNSASRGIEPPETGVAQTVNLGGVEPIQDVVAELSVFESKMLDFQNNSAGILEGVVVNFVEGFGNVVGAIATGRASFGEVGGLILHTMADLATQLGKAAIKIGVTMQAVKLSFTNPLGAIAAGVGLLVVAGIMKSLAGGFGGGKDAGAFANGGIVGGNSYYGDKLFARVNSGEAIFNQDQQKRLHNLTSSAGGANLSGSIGLRIDGRDLVGVIDKTNVQLARTS